MKPESQSPPPIELDGETLIAEAAPTASDLLCKELTEQKELNTSLIADFENFKRRSRQEGETRAAAQKESFIQDLLPFIDNLERALASGGAPGSKQFHEGVEMTLQQLRQLLRQHGIEIEDSIGQPFDPRRHEAVSQRHDPAHADQTVLEVFQRGYRRDEKVFRPAKVAVNSHTHSPRARQAR